jgi:hypothetical protein
MAEMDMAELMSVGECAKHCNLTEGQLRLRIKHGELPIVRVADRVFVKRPDFLEFLRHTDH